MKKVWKKVVFFAVMILCGIALGIGIAALEDHLGMEFGVEFFLAGFLSLVLGMWLAVILHEGGHMVGALLSGYQFVSFRIGSLMLIRDKEGFHLKQFSLAGTGGQCLMDPPEMKDGSFPFLIYNMGGFLANLISAAVSAGICFWVRPGKYLMVFFAVFGIVSLYLGLVNGIPLKVGGVDNDGRNNVSMKKSALARKCLWLQLRVNGELVRGVRLKDMPDEWFELPPLEEMTDALSATLGAMAVSRFLDAMELEKARKLGDELLEKNAGLMDVQRKMLQGEMLFLELLGAQRPEKLEEYDKKEFQKFLAMTKKYPSTVRLQYAHALLIEKDAAKAEKWKKYFEKIIKIYPNAGEIPGEKELMACVERRGA